MNSRDKGKRGERQWRDELRKNGYHARRGQQFSGSPDSPDVICDGLPWAHFEVKFVEHLNFSAAMAQARRDAGGPTASAGNRGKVPFVVHRKNFWPWLVTMEAERFYRFLRRDLTGEWATHMAAGSTPVAACGEVEWVHCHIITGRRLNIHEAMRQTQRDAGKRVAVVAHQDRDGRWLVTITAETFFKFLGGTLPPENKPTEQTKQQQQIV
jgi:hypothetical protein